MFSLFIIESVRKLPPPFDIAQGRYLSPPFKGSVAPQWEAPSRREGEPGGMGEIYRYLTFSL
jgi:hypothetical protein